MPSSGLPTVLPENGLPVNDLDGAGRPKGSRVRVSRNPMTHVRHYFGFRWAPRLGAPDPLTRALLGRRIVESGKKPVLPSLVRYEYLSDEASADGRPAFEIRGGFAVESGSTFLVGCHFEEAGLLLLRAGRSIPVDRPSIDRVCHFPGASQRDGTRPTTERTQFPSRPPHNGTNPIPKPTAS
jgi:hypothetical protein